MAKIRSEGSKIEVKMKEALEKHHVDFEYQPKLFGKPDFLIKPRIVVFCDSSF
jgi:G:T-mismatch repair DNA endonuclease (very short patch repair protein)